MLATTAETPSNIRPDMDEQTSSIRTWIANDILHIEGLPIGKPYRIFNISGTMVYQGIATTDIVRVENFQPLPSGTYIIQSEQGSVRFVR